MCFGSHVYISKAAGLAPIRVFIPLVWAAVHFSLSHDKWKPLSEALRSWVKHFARTRIVNVGKAVLSSSEPPISFKSWTEKDAAGCCCFVVWKWVSYFMLWLLAVWSGLLLSTHAAPLWPQYVAFSRDLISSQMLHPESICFKKICFHI